MTVPGTMLRVSCREDDSASRLAVFPRLAASRWALVTLQGHDPHREGDYPGAVPVSLLRTLATHREPSEPIRVRYDEAAQVSYVLEADRWVPSWESRSVQDTKKCDHETGEDQKGT